MTTTRSISSFSLTAAAFLALAGCTATDGVDPKAVVGPDKIVYHVNDTGAQGANTLRNINNHLEINPQAKIVVVAHAQGVDFLFDGAKDRNGNPYNIAVEELKGRGVKFDVCDITLRNRQISKSRFIPEATYVPSGVVEIARLQQRGGYAYIRP
jgi:hypothetical protein